MASFEEAAEAVRKSLGKKENRIEWQPGFLGDGNGSVRTSRANYYWVRYPYESSPAAPVYGVGNFAEADGLRIIVGYLPWQPGQFQIITVSDQRINVVSATDTPPNPDYVPLQSHAVNHMYLNVDPVYVNWRQVTPLGVFPTYPASLSVEIRAGYIPRPGADISVDDQTIDLTSHVPGVGARYVLISYDSTGVVVATDGTINSSGFSALTIADIPDTPAGNWRSCAVVLYVGQTEIVETRSENDFLDLRFPEEHPSVISPLIVGTVTKTGDYTATSADDVIVCNKATAMTITLPAATGTGKIYWIKSIGAGEVTINANLSETIDGELTQTVQQWECICIHDYAAGVWAII